MNDIEQFLQAARSEGTFHSEGRFSLDAQRAERLLSCYQLSDRTWYVLKLVQCAVAAGASEIHFINTKESCRVLFFGWSMDFFDTREVVAAMTQDSLSRRGALKHLAVAVTAAMALDPLSLEWSVWNAYQQERLIFDKSGTHFEKLYQSPFAHLESHSQGGFVSGYAFCLTRKPVEEPSDLPPPTWLDRLRCFWRREVQNQGSVASEHHLISQRCCFAPIVVKLDGRRVNQPMDFCPRPSGFQLIVLDGSRNTVALPTSSKERATALELEQRDDSTLASTPYFGASKAFLHCFLPEGGGQHRQVVVHDGVMLSDSMGDFPLLMSSVELDLDLSEQSIIGNEVYGERVERISHLLRRCQGTSGDGRLFQSALARWVAPRFQRLTPVDLPPTPYLVVKEDDGYLRSVTSMLNSACSIRLSDNGQAVLESPNNIWPKRPPEDPCAWRIWLKRAVHTVANGDYYRFTSEELVGPYFHGDDLDDKPTGVWATFHVDGQIKSLYYAHRGRPIGWCLKLERGVARGEVSHVEDRRVYRYPEDAIQPIRGKDGPVGQEVQAWGDWVESWILAVYRDSQLRVV